MKQDAGDTSSATREVPPHDDVEPPPHANVSSTTPDYLLTEVMFISPKRRDLYPGKKMLEYKKKLKVEYSKAEVAELEVQRIQMEEFNHFFICAEGNHRTKFKRD